MGPALAPAASCVKMGGLNVLYVGLQGFSSAIDPRHQHSGGQERSAGKRDTELGETLALSSIGSVH